MKISNNKQLYFLLFIINAVWFCVFSQMSPQADDFWYVTTPRGGNSFLARPIDELIGVILKSYPPLFPWFNRMLVLTGHFINCVMFHKLAVCILKQKEYTAIFPLLFSMSPWVYAAISQTDSNNNVLSLTFCTIGAYLYFHADNERKANLYYIVFAALALGTKESGVAALAIIPGLLLVKVIHDELELRGVIKRLFRSYILGFILLAVYFVIFYIIREYCPYIGWKNKAFIYDLIGKAAFPFAAFTGVNTFNVFNGLWLNALIGLLLSTPLVILAFINFFKTVKDKNRTAFVAPLLFFCGELFILPSQMFAYISDMHMYPFTFFVLLIVLYYLPKVPAKRLSRVFLVLYGIAFFFSSAEKVYWQNISSGYVRDFQNQAYILLEEDCERIYTVFPHISIVDQGTRYGGYANDWFNAQYGGESLREVYGFDISIIINEYFSVDEIDRLAADVPNGYSLLVVYPDRSMTTTKELLRN